MSAKVRVDYFDLTEEQREAIHAWVDGHGIDHTDVPIDGVRFDAHANEYVITVACRNADGRNYLNGAGRLATREERRPAEPELPWPCR